jgi:hypothetical protein
MRLLLCAVLLAAAAPSCWSGATTLSLQVQQLECSRSSCSGPAPCVKKQTWLSDTELEVQAEVSITLSAEVLPESGSFDLKGNTLTLSYGSAGRRWEPGAAVPACIVPVALTYRLVGLPKAAYEVVVRHDALYGVRGWVYGVPAAALALLVWLVRRRALKRAAGFVCVLAGLGFTWALMVVLFRGALRPADLGFTLVSAAAVGTPAGLLVWQGWRMTLNRVITPVAWHAAGAVLGLGGLFFGFEAVSTGRAAALIPPALALLTAGLAAMAGRRARTEVAAGRQASG